LFGVWGPPPPAPPKPTKNMAPLPSGRGWGWGINVTLSNHSAERGFRGVRGKLTELINVAQSYQILPAGWRDLGPVRRVEQECFGADAWPLLDILAVLSLPGVVRIKAVVRVEKRAGGMEEEIAGFIAGEIKGPEKIGWVTTVGVTQAYRRRGIGAALLAACEQQLGAARVRLCVRQSNLNALMVYWQTGYHQVDVWKRYYSGGEDALVMEKLMAP
jgi:ribosomal protein S18 acetylase RimI-like enzyme